MSLSSKIREQLISSFRAELVEHVQTMTNGLLAIEQGRAVGEQRQATLQEAFRAAHSLKGAARVVGVTAIEQLAHALESVLDALQRQTLQVSSELFSACYQTLDTIQAVQAAYEGGAITPPIQALQALAALDKFHSQAQQSQPAHAAPDQVANLAEAASVPTAVSTPAQSSATDPKNQAGAAARLPKEKLQERIDELFTAAASSSPGAQPSDPATLSPAVNVPDRSPVDNPSSRVETVSADVNSAAGRNASVQPAPAPETQAVSQDSLAHNPDNDETIRVRIGKLDTLMDQLSELVVLKIRTEQRLTQVQQLQDLMNVWQKEWRGARAIHGRLSRHRDHGTDSVDAQVEFVQSERRQSSAMKASQLSRDAFRLLDYTGGDQDRLRQARALLNDLEREYANDSTQMSLAIDELEQDVKRLRMLPLNTITAPFGRMVRDLALKAGKEAILHINGGETELDKHVLERIKDPLIHLLRNAIDHGIETPVKRLEQGKPRAGTITLSAEQLGKDVVICVSDDGHGLDPDAIRRAAARHSKLDAQTLSDADLEDLIFKPGVSTSPIITDVSGRGVGLDVVRRNIEGLHGRCEVEWQPGKGASFTLTIPLRLTGSRGLLVRVSDQLFAIPVIPVEFILSVRPEQIIPIEGHDTIRYNGRSIALMRLDDVLGLPRSVGQSLDREIPVVILAAAERRLAFAVDALAGEQEIVIKGLGKQLLHINGIAGATVMGSGEVVLILNVPDVIKLALRSERRSVLDMAQAALPQAERSQRRILIVDDSITTRTLEKNILEAAGYAVQIATDGMEALNTIAASDLPDLIVADIVMPRLNGFDLTRRLKENTQTAHLPVILVSSLDSAEDKARGIQAGADAYITKGSFDQNNLLETIEQMIASPEDALSG